MSAGRLGTVLGVNKSELAADTLFVMTTAKTLEFSKN